MREAFDGSSTSSGIGGSSRNERSRSERGAVAIFGGAHSPGRLRGARTALPGRGPPMTRRCSVCEHPLLAEVDALLASGSSIRLLARTHGIPRTTLARHKDHAQVSASRLALIRGSGGPDGPDGPLDPLAAALDLASRAKTDRERLKAAESVRSATLLAMRALRGGDLDAEMLDRLDANVVRAAELYREVGGSFENELRGLQGHRSAIRQRLEAARAPDAVEVAVTVALSDGTPTAEPVTVAMPAALHWAGVPRHLRDPSRYTVDRVTQLVLGSTRPGESIKVHDARGVLVWSHETPTPKPIWEEENDGDS